MVGSDRSRSGSQKSGGGAFLARDVMMLAYQLSQISKDDITCYGLDRLTLLSVKDQDKREGSSSAALSRSHVLELHRRLQRHLEDTTIRLLNECDDIKPVEVDTNRIARELELYCLENSSISLRLLKAMLYKGMQHFDRLPACLQLLLNLKDTGTPSPRRSPNLTPERRLEYSPEPARYYNNEEVMEDLQPEGEASAYDEQRDEEREEYSTGSTSLVSRSVDLQSEESVASRIVTDRFEFAEIEEQDLINDIVFVLQGVEGRFIKCNHDGSFTLTSERRVSRAVRQLTNRICTLGQLYNRIVNAKLPSGGIGSTLYQAVMDQIHQYNRLVNLLVSGRSQKPLTLRQIYVWVQQPYTRLRLLHMALEISSIVSMDHVFNLYCSRGDAMGRELYNELLRRCMTPYLEVLLRWVYLGELQDTSNMFFVKKTKDRYQLSLSRVPRFVSHSLARLCYDVGCCSCYCTQLKISTKVDASIPNLIKQLLHDGPSWSVFLTTQRLVNIVASIETSAQLARVLIEKHCLLDYVDRMRRHLGMEYLVSDKDSDVYNDYQVTKEYGFDIYVPKFSFPLNLILDDEKLNCETYIRNFRLDFLLARTMKLLSVCWSEHNWNSRCSLGSLELSKRLNWINLCRNEMSHFCQVIQSSRNVQFVLQRFIASVYRASTSSTGFDLKYLKDEYSRVLSLLHIEHFLEVVEILECIVDFCKLVPHLFNRNIMQELHLMLREQAHPADITDFIHRRIATNEITRVLSHHAHRFRENVMLLLDRLLSNDAERQRLGSILDYNSFYRMLRVVAQ